GHGLLKLMRRPQSLTYRIWKLPKTPEVLSFLAAEAGMESKAAYSTSNMGAGYAIYCRSGAGAGIVDVATGLGLRACIAGGVEEGPRGVVLEPVGVRLEGGEIESTARAPYSWILDLSSQKMKYQRCKPT